MNKTIFLKGVLILWAGLILGVSFIATPVKFMAPHLTMSVALEIGRATYYIFNKVEWGIFFLMIFLISRINLEPIRGIFVGVLFLLLTLETFWLLPILDARASHVISGEIENPGALHKVYIISEALKIIVTFMGACWITTPGRKSTSYS